MLRPPAVLVTVLALLLAAGCGGDSDDSANGGGGTGTNATGAATSGTTATGSREVSQYRSEVTRISTDFARAGQTFKNSVSPTSTPEQAAEALEQFQSKVTGAASDLAGLTPPEGVQAPQLQLIAAFRGIARACQPAIDAGKAGNRTQFRTALRSLQSQLNGALGNQAKRAAQQIDAGLAGQ
jgi:hypothetical protein